MAELTEEDREARKMALKSSKKMTFEFYAPIVWFLKLSPDEQQEVIKKMQEELPDIMARRF